MPENFFRRFGFFRREVSLVTAIKDRSQSLEAAFATWARIPGIFEIIIVDWSSADSSAIERVARLDRRVRVARVENEVYFNHTRTKNLGVRLSTGDTVLVTDADIRIGRSLRRLFAEVRAKDTTFFRGWIPGGYGTIVVRRRMFEAVGGYDERMEGWGGSDDDLYLRLTLNGLQSVNIPEGILSHIDHPEELRHVNMLVRGRTQSQQRNTEIVEREGLWSKEMYASSHRPIRARVWQASGGAEEIVV